MGQTSDNGFTVKDDGTIVRNPTSSKVDELKKKISSAGNGGNSQPSNGNNNSRLWIILLIVLGVIIGGGILFNSSNESYSEVSNSPSALDENSIVEEQEPINPSPQVTPDPLGLCPDNNHPHKIDMGDGVKWACCNVGASSPIEYGNYYQWGDVFTRSEYKWDNYKWCDGNENTLTKYNNNSSYGIVDNKTILEERDDAASHNWGSAWRMPNKDEVDYLVKNYTWLWTTINGVNGYKVKASNGNFIFLPAAGICNKNGNVVFDGDWGRYWSNSFESKNAKYAIYIDFSKESHLLFSSTRYWGMSIRPVVR